MRILLIRSPYSADTRSLAKLADFPLGLAYIAAVLEKDGHEVAVIDALIEGFNQESRLGKHLIRYGLSDEELKKRIAEFSPDLVGVSCLFSTQADNAHNVCRIVKEVNKDIITVMGGSHPSVMWKETLGDENLDFVVIGEGEYTIRDLLRKMESQSDYSTLDGLAFKNDGEIKANPKTKFIENLDELPFPARHYFAMEKYFDPDKWQVSPCYTPAATLMSSRGCPANCIFCSIHTVWGRGFRARSAQNVLNEVGLLVERYGVKEIQFVDDNLTLDKKRLLEICEGIKMRFPYLKWLAVGTALWALDEEMLISMRQSGCYRIYLPVESGDQEVLNKIVKKPLRLDKIPLLLKKMRTLGIEVHGFFVVGLPGETAEQVERTLRYTRKLNLDASYIFYATPHPGTEMYDICKKNNYIINELDYKSLDSRKIHIETPVLSAEKLRSLMRRHNIIQQWRMFCRHPIREIPRIIDKLRRDLKQKVLKEE